MVSCVQSTTAACPHSTRQTAGGACARAAADAVLDGMLRAIPRVRTIRVSCSWCSTVLASRCPRRPLLPSPSSSTSRPACCTCCSISSFSFQSLPTPSSTLSSEISIRDSTCPTRPRSSSSTCSPCLSRRRPCSCSIASRLALAAVKPYYLRPKPVGVVAQRVLRMLTLEQGSPGASLRALCETTAAVDRTLHLLMPAGVPRSSSPTSFAPAPRASRRRARCARC
jgi:hypothetical protein